MTTKYFYEVYRLAGTHTIKVDELSTTDSDTIEDRFGESFPDMDGSIAKFVELDESAHRQVTSLYFAYSGMNWLVKITVKGCEE